jgi:cell division protease FtsH
MDKMHIMADALMKYETIDVKQIDEIMDGKIPSAPENWGDDDNSDTKDGGGSSTAKPKDSPATTPVS